MTGTPPRRAALDDAMRSGSSPQDVSTPGSRGDAVRSSILRLAERFRPQEALGLEARWTIRIPDHGAYTVHVRDGRCFVSVGAHPRADAEVETDAATWLEIVSGRTDGVAAFSAGKLFSTGDLNLALRLDTVFLPGPESRRFLRTTRHQVRGVHVESFIAGHGKPPIILLHGLAASKVSFIPTIDGLADRFEVHALDLPGFGKSDMPLPSGRRYTAAWMADIVHGYMRASGLRQAYLVGNSMGGRIAVEVGLRHPNRVLGVVGLGAAVAFDEWQWAGTALRLLQSQWVGIAPLPLRQSWLEAGIGDLFHDRHVVPQRNVTAAAAEVIRELREPRHRMALAACARHLVRERARGRRSFWRRIEGLRVPSYWIWGESDPLSSSRYAEKVRERLPQARVEVWEAVGHVPQFEVPERTNEAILDFIGELQRR